MDAIIRIVPGLALRFGKFCQRRTLKNVAFFGVFSPNDTFLILKNMIEDDGHGLCETLFSVRQCAFTHAHVNELGSQDAAFFVIIAALDARIIADDDLRRVRHEVEKAPAFENFTAGFVAGKRQTDRSFASLISLQTAFFLEGRTFSS